MQSNQQLALHPETRTYSYSLDWRFLLPIAGDAKLLVLSEGSADFTQALERVGIAGLDWHEGLSSILDAKQDEVGDLHGLVIPFGLPVHRVGIHEEDHIEFYRSARRLIHRGGYLLVGFENVWKFRSKARFMYHFSSPRRMNYQLRQSGYTSVEIFGAIPNLSIPEYIFHLQSQTLDFALRHRFRRKAITRNILRWLLGRIGSSGVSALLPCYFAVAM